jgi:hypothetical protein
VSEVIGFQLTLVKQEASAGPFSADILAEDPQGHQVIIENQLEQTNHDHLGKLITYMSNLDAKTAIWITSDPRPEHEKSVHWLNETLPEDTSFFLLKIEAYKINDSDPAPQFSIIAGPSQAGKQVGRQKKELAERHYLRRDFWTQLLEHAKSKTKLTDRISPSTDNWLSFGSGKSGLNFAFVVRMDDAHVELYIDTGNVGQNKNKFDELFSKKDTIEKNYGHPLEWQRLDNKRACRIRYVISGHGLSDKANWPTLITRLVDEMINFHRSIQPQI